MQIIFLNKTLHIRTNNKYDQNTRTQTLNLHRREFTQTRHGLNTHNKKDSICVDSDGKGGWKGLVGRGRGW